MLLKQGHLLGGKLSTKNGTFGNFLLTILLLKHLPTSNF